MEGFLLRAPLRDEAAAIAELLNAHSAAVAGRLDVTIEDVAYWFDEPGLDPERDMRVAVAADGTFAAYADLGGGEEDGEPVWIDLRIRPGREAAGRTLLAAIERNAARRGAPPRPLRAAVNADDPAAGELLRAAGYRALRSGYRMEIDVTVHRGAPTWPDGVVVRPLAAGEERGAYEAYLDAFAGSPDFFGVPFEQWMFWLFEADEDSAFAFVAEEGAEIAGLSILRERRGGDLDLGWIHVIGVRPPWRRRGLGRALLLHAFHELRARGKPRAGLGVDGDNVDAVRLYEAAGMRVVRRNDVYEKVP